MIRRLRRRRREDRGAVAVVFAGLVVVLFMVGALTVDLGQAYVAKNVIQKRADFAALAGAAGDNLPGATAASCAYGPAAQASDQAILDVAAYLSETAGGGEILPADLVDCDLSDGEAGYGMFAAGACAGGTCLTADPNRLSVVSQPRNVTFGLAQVMGFTDVDVRGQATAEISTPLISGLPFYAFNGCDYGNQTISQPNPGNVAATVLLSHEDETNDARPTTLTVFDGSDPAAVPALVADPDDFLTLNAVSGTLAGVTEVGFFLAGTVAAGPEPEVVPSSGFTIAPGNGSLTVQHLPTSVTSVDALWYVRVKIGGQWSPLTTGNGGNEVLRALPLKVGAPDLTCGQGPSSGNFGTLDLPPSVSGVNGTTKEIAYNIIHGIHPGLAPFPASQFLPPDYLCTSSPAGTILWPDPGTNCISTQTGMNAEAAEQGFITGFGSYPEGLLAKGAADSSTHCPNDYPTGTPHTTTVQSRTVNNDILSCYFTDDSVTVGQVSSQGYAGGPAHRRGHLRVPPVRARARGGQPARPRWVEEVPDRDLPARLHHRPAAERDARDRGAHRVRDRVGQPGDRDQQRHHLRPRSAQLGERRVPQCQGAAEPDAGRGRDLHPLHRLGREGHAAHRLSGPPGAALGAGRRPR